MGFGQLPIPQLRRNSHLPFSQTPSPYFTNDVQSSPQKLLPIPGARPSQMNFLPPFTPMQFPNPLTVIQQQASRRESQINTEKIIQLVEKQTSLIAQMGVKINNDRQLNFESQKKTLREKLKKLEFEKIGQQTPNSLSARQSVLNSEDRVVKTESTPKSKVKKNKLLMGIITKEFGIKERADTMPDQGKKKK